jgi:four helix bundle protein
MDNRKRVTTGKPFDIRHRLLEFACEIVGAAQFLHTRGPVGRALSHQLLTAGTSIGANMQEADGAASRPDFIVKVRIALKEAKETWFRLSVCRRCELLDARFDPLVNEANEIVRILASIVHKTIKNTKP